MTEHHIETARAHLGELATMAHQTEAMERKILQRAQALVSEVASKIDKARAAALAGGDAEQDAYMELVKERGRLHQVIAQAQEALHN